MQELLITIVKGLVENPDAVTVTVDEPDDRGVVVYHLHVAEDDMGRVIGKQGRIAKAIRKIIGSPAKTEDSDKLRVLYRETIAHIAVYEGIRNTPVKTPREIQQEISNPCTEVTTFLTEYEYLHYADVSVSETDLEKMKTLSAKILERYHEKNN